MNSAKYARKRSTLVLVLAILSFASSFFIRGGSETGVRFFLWRDQPLVALALAILAAVLLFIWWRGVASKPSA